jgi:hypothetical protein
MFQATYFFEQDATGRQGVLQMSESPKMSKVFGGTNPFYVGQSFVIQEVFTIISEVRDFSLLRTEDRWYQEKRYIGTWQRLARSGLALNGTDDYGLIRSEVQELSRYRTWTISADPAVKIQLGDGGRIRQCNFILRPEPFVPKGGVNIVAGFVPTYDTEQFIYEDFVQPAQLIDREYDLYFAGMGFYFYPGCVGIRAELAVSVINVVYSGADKWDPPKCDLTSATCDEQFAAYILANNQGQPLDAVYEGDDITGHYSSEGACNATAGVPCGEMTYICSDRQTRTYWIRQAI